MDPFQYKLEGGRIGGGGAYQWKFTVSKFIMTKPHPPPPPPPPQKKKKGKCESKPRFLFVIILVMKFNFPLKLGFLS